MAQHLRPTKFQLHVKSTLPRAHRIVYDMLIRLPQNPLEEQRIRKLCELVSHQYGYMSVLDQQTTFDLFCEEMDSNYGVII